MEFPDSFLVQVEEEYRSELQEMMSWLAECRGPYNNPDEEDSVKCPAARRTLVLLLVVGLSIQQGYQCGSNSLLHQLYLRHWSTVRDILARYDSWVKSHCTEAGPLY